MKQLPSKRIALLTLVMCAMLMTPLFVSAAGQEEGAATGTEPDLTKR